MYEQLREYPHPIKKSHARRQTLQIPESQREIVVFFVPCAIKIKMIVWAH